MGSPILAQAMKPRNVQVLPAGVGGLVGPIYVLGSLEGDAFCQESDAVRRKAAIRDGDDKET